MNVFRFGTIALVLSGLCLLNGCGQRGADKDRDGKKKIRLAFVTNNPAEFWNIAEKGTEKAAKDFDVHVEFKKPPRGSAEEQRQIIEDLLNKGIQGIAVSPNDADNSVGFFKDQVYPKVPLIMQDSDVPDPKARRAYIGTHNYRAGRAIGDMILKDLPKGSKVAIFVGKLDVRNAVERRQGVLDVLLGQQMPKDEVDLAKITPRDAENLKVGDYILVATKTDDVKQDECQRRAEDLLGKDPTIDCLVGLWAYNPPALLRACNTVKLKKMPIIYGFDEDDQTLDAIKEGTIKATVVQDPFNFGYESIKILKGLAQGDPKAISGADDQNRIFVPHRVVNKDNVVEFHKELKKLQGRAN